LNWIDEKSDIVFETEVELARQISTCCATTIKTKSIDSLCELQEHYKKQKRSIDNLVHDILEQERTLKRKKESPEHTSVLFGIGLEKVDLAKKTYEIVPGMCHRKSLVDFIIPMFPDIPGSVPDIINCTMVSNQSQIPLLSHLSSVVSSEYTTRHTITSSRSEDNDGSQQDSQTITEVGVQKIITNI